MIKKSLLRSLNDWTAAGIITAAQKESIVSFEEKKSGGIRSRWALYGFLILGASIVGIGLISLIASNWEEIPGGAKLIMDFILLAGAAIGVLVLDKREGDILYDSAMSLFALFILASIGLIAQVFHTGGEPYQALFFWAAIIFPLSLLTKKGFLPYLWTAAFLCAVIVFFISENTPWHESWNEDDTFLSLFLMLPFMCYFISSLMKRSAVLRLHGRAFSLCALLALLGTIGITDVYISSSHHSDLYATLLIPGAGFACLSILSLFLDPGASLKEKIVILIMTLITALPYIPLLFPADPDALMSGNEFFGAVYTIVMLILLSIFFVIKDKKRLFNAATLLAGLRFLIVYFQVFKDLAATGFGLIFSGLLIIGVSLLWFKQHDNLERLFRSILGDKPHDGNQ